MRVAVFGHGLIGTERTAALRALIAEGMAIEWAVCDPPAPGKQASIEAAGGRWLRDMAEAERFGPDWAIIATPHDTAVEITSRMLLVGCRVLMEKPLGRSLEEAARLRALESEPGRLFVGFNYRFFEGIAALIRDAHEGGFGELVSADIILGHGGAPDMEKGWKFDPVKAGGGCLIDPGIHVLDLLHQLFPAGLEVLAGAKWSGFWKTGIEEEVHLLLRGGACIINMQVSVVRWRSTFRFELHGTEGYGIVAGRGRSYGPQTYTRGRRWGWQHAGSQEASEEKVLVTDCSGSFREELRALFGNRVAPLRPCDAAEAHQVMKIYDKCLRSL